MVRILRSFRTLKPWQVGVLLVMLVAGFGATYGVYTLLNRPAEGLAADQQLVPVRRGDLVSQVSLNGSLVFPQKQALSFGVQGVVQELLVEEGQQVEQGQELARLDPATVATLEKAVARARLDLKNAEDALAEAREAATALEMAQAEADVASARLALKAARQALDTLLDPPAEDLAEAEADVASARLAVQAAQEALKAARGGPEEQALDSARARVNSAAVALSNAIRDLGLAEEQWGQKLQDARDAANEGLEGYRNAFMKWLGVDLTAEEAARDPDALVQSWGADLGALFDPRLRYQDMGRWTFTRGAPTDDPATRWSEPILYSWLNLFPGTILARCGDRTLPPTTLCVERELLDAWKVHRQAQEALNTTQTEAAKALDSARDAVTQAEDKLATAREDLAELEAGSDDLEVASKEKELALAQARLKTAEEELARLTGDPDPLELEEKQKQVALAEAALADAEQTLADLRAGADPLEVALREAEVASARAALEQAIEALDGAVLRAPWNGIVSNVAVEAGETVNAGAAVVEVVDPTVVELDGVVDEIDVLSVSQGTGATVTMDALPGRALTGTVSSVSTVANSQQGVVSYPIRIRLEVPQDVQLREGLSAVANVVLRQEQDKLLVPLQALYGSFNQPVVRVMKDGRIEDRPVKLGSSDDFWAVVEEGLQEGETVVMKAPSSSAGQAGFVRFGGPGAVQVAPVQVVPRPSQGGRR